jgi:hypothetical protein
LLQENLTRDAHVVKTSSNTRWSARHDATQSLAENYIPILTTLLDLSGDKNEKADTRYEASCLTAKMETLEICIMTLLWNKVLCRFHAVSEALQSSQIDLRNAVDLFTSLSLYIMDIRESFNELEALAKQQCGSDHYIQGK